uniref:3 beta-hydroxysteroid dehydrogenase type 7-like n=1 Tax=Ciona intestinalis TaxID=7719 RepID=UPI000180C10E|nr:3 beta-hydroxysteroid dehydrogenase type 7-like [Ciona intestinalis]|eukprot:XP_002127579.1 3 beta-hydroxysteroid dehydrogenase type 7-like [Ciona intestinalis]
MGKVYLISGAAGRLGSRVVRVLCENNIDDVEKVKLVDLRFSKTTRDEQEEYCKGAGITAEWIENDVTDYEAMASAVNQVNVVIHTAAIVDYTGEVPDSKLWDTNVRGTEVVLKACLDQNVEFFVYTSSIDAVGPNWDMDSFVNGNEDTPYKFNPPIYYATTKNAAEKRVVAANGRPLENGKKFFSCALRPGGIYGENDPVLEAIVSRLGKSKAIRSVCEPTALKERPYLGNVAWGHIVAAKKIQEKPDLIGGNAYFIGDDTPKLSYSRLNLLFCEHLGYTLAKPEPYFSIWKLYLIAYINVFASKFMSWFGIKIKVIVNPAVIRISNTNFTTSYEKLRKHIGYKPLYSWEQSLAVAKKDMERIVEPTFTKES